MSIIKKGYRITVASWENDADHNATSSRDGLTKEEAQFHFDLLKLVSICRCDDLNMFGNIYAPSDADMEEFEEAVAVVAQKHNQLSFDLDAAQGVYYDYMICTTNFYTRVAKTVIVEFIPEDIHIQDVTAEFM